MLEAGLIAGHLIKTPDQPLTVLAARLIWAGHHFLDAARNDTPWRRTLTRVSEKLGSVSFDLLKSLLIEEGKDALSKL